ncbi:MAG: hypothetical protein JNL34_02590 [Anaerolineae bacterium]|nr:hypothetical protein [Anaerolineae bacterium]
MVHGDPINRRPQPPAKPHAAISEPTLHVAGGRYSESWLRANTGNLHGILAEIATEFLSAVDRARTVATQTGDTPELVQVMKPATHRQAPDIPVRYEAPIPWRMVQRLPTTP